jgi:hypothetical protein
LPAASHCIEAVSRNNALFIATGYQLGCWSCRFPATVQSPNKPNSFMGIGWSLYESLTKERSAAVCRFVLHRQQKKKKGDRGKARGDTRPLDHLH